MLSNNYIILLKNEFRKIIYNLLCYYMNKFTVDFNMYIQLYVT